MEMYLDCKSNFGGSTFIHREIWGPEDRVTGNQVWIAKNRKSKKSSRTFQISGFLGLRLTRSRAITRSPDPQISL
jgi:hypothetical protein